MDAVTYPHKTIQQFVQSNFVAAKIEFSKQPELAKNHHVVWTPTLQFIDPQGWSVRHQSVGYLSPDDFLSQGSLALGQYHFHRKEYEKASSWFLKIEKDFPSSSDIPEALYWAGVTDYKKAGKPDGLLVIWKRMLSTYPDSPWANRVSFIQKK